MIKTTTQLIREYLQAEAPDLIFVSRKAFHDKKNHGCMILSPKGEILHRGKSGEVLQDQLTQPGFKIYKSSIKRTGRLDITLDGDLSQWIREAEKRCEYYGSPRGRRDHPESWKKYYIAARLELKELKGE